MNYTYKLGFLGAGNMAKAIAQGIIKSNILKKDDIIMSDLSGKTNFEGIKITQDNNIILKNCEYVLIAIKPQVFNSIISTFKDSKAICAISIMAGINIEKIQNAFNDNVKIIRVMPNTPSSVGLGMSCLTYKNADKENIAFAKTIFEAIGKVLFLDESKFDAVTSISGSGPAYIYYFIKAMIDGGISGGLSLEEAKMLTLQTMVGACKMVEVKDEDLSTLIQNVCSKGGTTIQAIDTFNANNLDKIIVDGINKCRNRSEELSK